MGRDLARSRSPQGKHTCKVCHKQFTSAASLRRHIDEQHLEKGKLECPSCPSLFRRKDDLDRHWEAAHESSTEPEVPRTPGRNLDVLQLHPDKADRRAVETRNDHCPAPVRRVTTMTSMVGTLSTASVETRNKGVQTEHGEGQVVERTTQELFDGKTVVAKITKERFVYE
ncbi:histone-lysine N-methyltransferase MECOM-like [Patiria miniata]|uniref:C2H2-type domain-containing protein n=1 Tax=Patiria miniata TaxID=46514 RepID=A0A914A7J7_PATMI|nr:histone-lysine N-methyltransferase MECOM-like [Patiria miniata]